MSECPDEVKKMIWDAVHGAPVLDVRCFVPPPGSGDGHASGVDALLCSREILGEFRRRRSLAGTAPGEWSHTEEGLRALAPGELADLVWRRLFLDSSPLSEPARVVLTALGLFGMAVEKRDLRLFREEFAKMTAPERLEKTFALANLEAVLYPVDCLEMDEAAVKASRHPRFRPVLRLDRLLDDWKESARVMRGLGYGVKGKIDDFAPLELRRFLLEQVNRLGPVAVAYDWPRDLSPDEPRGVSRLLFEAVLPLCRERSLAFCVAAGDGPNRPAGEGAPPPVIGELSPLWRDNPDVKFLLFPTDSSQLSSAAREAAERDNLLLCGPDAPLSHPSSLPAYTAERLETCGSAFHYCHSGATALEELAGRWAHLRWTLGEVMIRRYSELRRTGWRVGEEDVRSDAAAILGGNAKRFLRL